MKHVDPKALRPAEPTAEDFLEWARGKDPEDLYDYHEPGSCAFAQYLRERGHALAPRVTMHHWRDGHESRQWHDIPTPLIESLIPKGGPRVIEYSTFGELVRRVEAALG